MALLATHTGTSWLEASTLSLVATQAPTGALAQRVSLNRPIRTATSSHGG